MSKPLIDRIMSKVRYVAGCWEFVGARDPHGYGRVNTCGSGTALAHRAVYELMRGPITGVLDHMCRNPSCVNPWHLDDTTNEENIRRGAGRPRPPACPQGHPYTEDNLRNRGHGAECKKCHYAAVVRRNKRKALERIGA